MLKKLMILVMAFALLGTLVGCGKEDAASNKKVLYKATDVRGKTFEFSEKPKRIVCNYIWGDEILLDLVDHKRIAGLDKWVHDAQLSSAVKQAEDVTAVVEANPESILKLDPDLILMPASRLKQDSVKTFEEVGRKVFVYKDANRVHEIEDCITSIASAVGEPEQGKKLIAKLQADMDKVKQLNAKKLAQPKALMFMRFGAYGGRDTIYNDVITAAGFRDCYNDVREKTDKGMNLKGILSKEEVIRANPDVFLMAQWTVSGKFDTSKQQLEEMYNDPAFATVGAVKNKRAYVFPQRLVNDMSHHTGENILELAKITGRLEE